MKEEIVKLTEDVSGSSLYNEDLAPVPSERRTWNTWSLAAIWVGMAVCIPTYILASYMITSGLSWYAALIIIGLANLIITIPMVLNGHAGVKYGIPFPVLGRASFGTKGIHIAAIIRAIVACGWFGIQTWVGGLAIYEIWHAVSGTTGSPELDAGKFFCFGLFWLINVYFIWKGTESIKWLEMTAAPILVIIGILLIVWGADKGGGFMNVLDQSRQLELAAASLNIDEEQELLLLSLNPLKDKNGKMKATEYQVNVPMGEGQYEGEWFLIGNTNVPVPISYTDINADILSIQNGTKSVKVRFRRQSGEDILESAVVNASLMQSASGSPKFWTYLLWLTAMVGFWATMSLSIADITRYVHTQKEQVAGQFLGLPGTMLLYSFVGIFVTCAAVINFDDILTVNEAPWDPVTLLGRFKDPKVVVISQFFMLIATLSTNIAANVIAPANAFANLFPKKLSFRTGGMITAVIGILIAPWWLMDQIQNALLMVSGLLGPVLGVLLADYFVLRKMKLDLPGLYKEKGIYSYGETGFNNKAILAMSIGVALALVGYWVPAVSFLYTLSWFTGFAVSFFLYWILMRNETLDYKSS